MNSMPPMGETIISDGAPINGTAVEPEASGDVVAPAGDGQTPPAPAPEETTEEDT